MFGRLLDAGLRASLLLRGKVPAGLAAAAETTYREHLEADRFTYYGRVVRDGGYICLQYWFFYAMNDWRSTFRGVNDHEADWEMITIYLAESTTGALQPAWTAFSSHDYPAMTCAGTGTIPSSGARATARSCSPAPGRIPARSSRATMWSPLILPGCAR